MLMAVAVRYLMPGVIVLAVVFGLIGYGKHLESVERDAALLEQEAHVKKVMLAQAENLAAVQSALDQARKARQATVNIIHDKVVEYVHDPARKCVESRNFVELFDGISGVPARVEDRLPTSREAAGQPHELPASSPSSPEILRASEEPDITSAEIMQAYEHAVNALRELEDLYFALVQWVDTNYVIEQPED